MRVVAGLYGGRKLQVPKGRDIRPTSDKVRGAIFNTLGSIIRLDGVRVLDAFCGTGALGIEAISRGAAHCVFVDKARVSLDLARENVSVLGIEGQADFKVGDACKVHFKGGDPFDLVFLDPPYKQDMIVPVLEKLVEEEILSDQAVCVLEAEKNAVLDLPRQFELLKDKQYGDTLVCYARYKKSVV